MRRLLWSLLCVLAWSMPQALAQDPVADRAVAAAKDYVKARNLKDPKLTILLSSLYNNSFPDFARKWEQLTGVKFEIVPLGYTDIPAKIMQEGVAKTGVYDIFNDFPYTAPDAAGAKVIIPLDDYAAKHKPDFSGIADGLRFQQYYDGKLYTMVNDGDHLLLALRRDLVENPQARAEYRTRFNRDLGCPDTMAEWAQMAAFFQTKEGDTRWGVKFEKPLYGALGYRSINFSYRHFPAYMKGLLFDKDMKPRITTPEGIAATSGTADGVYGPPTGPYDITDFEATAHVVMTNKAPMNPFRGVGHVQAAFTMERIIDTIARERGLDPADVRMRNMIAAEDLPRARGLGNVLAREIVYDSGDYSECLRRALALDARWQAFAPAARQPQPESRFVISAA